jgi:glycine cleavage system H protein
MEIQGYQFKEGLFYDDDHIWYRKEGDVLVIGMDDFAQKAAGDIVFIQLPKVGKAVKQGKKIGKIESGKWLGQVTSPVEGELVEVNTALEADPGLVNKDCYGEGWMYKVKPADMGPVDSLRSDPAALESWMVEELEKYKDQLGG